MNIATPAPPRVLVVDDDAAIRRLLHDALSSVGCTVAEAASGQTGLEEFQTFQPDVILLDARMPGMDGVTTCALIRAMPEGGTIPILIVTGLDDDSTIDQAFAAGATDFVTKPFRLTVLRRRVRRLAEAHQAQQLLYIRDRAIAATTNGVVIVDARQSDNPIISVNPAFARLTGYSKDELLGRNCRMLQGPDTDPTTLADLRAAVAAGREISTPILNYRKDGTPFWNELAITPVRDSQDRLTHFVGVQQDISERMRMEQVVRESEERFRLLFEHSPDAIWLLDPHTADGDARIVTCNEAAVALHGYTRDELIGQPASILIPDADTPERRERVKRDNTRFWNTLRLLGEDRHRRKDGSVIDVEFSMTIVTVAGRELILSIDRDITARKRMETTLRASEERFRLLFEHSPDAIWLIDPHDAEVPWSIVDCNLAACEMHGYTREELIGQPIERFALPSEDPEQLRMDAERAEDFVRDGRIDSEGMHRRKDGTVIHIEYTDVLVVIDGRELVLGIDRDVTERHRAEEALRASEARYRMLFEHFPNGSVFLFDHNLCYSLARGTGLTASGLSPEQLEGKTLWEIFPPEIAARDEPVLRAALAGEATEVEVQYGEKTFAVHTLPVRDDRGTITGGMVMTQDITDRTRFEAELRHHAFYDRLTGLPNRALFLDRLGHALDRLNRGAAGVCAIFFLDLDQFKVVNDSLGHLAGDRLLVGTAKRLSEIMRTPDTLARFGGDEFAVLVEDIDDVTIAMQIAERIHEALAMPFMLEEHQVVVTASIGIAMTMNGAEQPEDLVRNADIAMYRAKARGKGQHALFDPDMYAHVLARLQMESDLRGAIEHGSFVLHYQPIVHLATGKITSVEALVRWVHPERGMIPPTRFIPVAEETGLIVPLGEWVLRAACIQMVAWQAEGVAPAHISVNISAQQLHRHDLIHTIRRILDETGLAPASLAVEVTETGMMEDVALATAALSELQEMGVEVLAVDDWGTGYASLSYLQQLPVTHIKIDRAFVHDMTTNANNATLVRTMIAMAHGLNLRTIAEGVETDEQRSLLHTYGCDAFQGYLVSRPLPAEALLPRLELEQ